MSDAAVISEILATGRRKTSVARVRVRQGHGKIVVNDKPMEEFFSTIQQRAAVVAPLDLAGLRDQLDIRILVNGGGTTGQSDACKLGIARALKKYRDDLLPALRESGYLTRDGRMKERKKYGLRGARRGTQFSKR